LTQISAELSSGMRSSRTTGVSPIADSPPGLSTWNLLVAASGVLASLAPRMPELMAQRYGAVRSRIVRCACLPGRR
jgi:hypothetical protein